MFVLRHARDLHPGRGTGDPAIRRVAVGAGQQRVDVPSFPLPECWWVGGLCHATELTMDGIDVVRG